MIKKISGKNIIIYSDGTGQAGGKKPDQRLSNIYKMYRASRVSPTNEIDPNQQVAFYDVGLGTDEDTNEGKTRIFKFCRKLISSVTGRGITRNITDCYEAIINLYEDGDRIYLLGFSRGAYTARCVANVLTLCGIPTSGVNGKPLRKNHSSTRKIADEAVRKVYEHGAGRNRSVFQDERQIKAARFRQKYQSDKDASANVIPYFIGVFDTVAALGLKGFARLIVTILVLVGIIAIAAITSLLLSYFLAWDFLTSIVLIVLTTGIIFISTSLKSSLKFIGHYPKKGRFRFHIAKWKMKNYDKSLSPRIPYARHAIAIDETRKNFARVPWGFKFAKYEKDAEGPEPFIQLWFSGNHSDIGGSYPENESRLSDIALNWMVEETEKLPLPILYEKRHLRMYPSSGAMQHSEVDAMRARISKWIPLLPEKYIPSWKEKSRKSVLGAPVHKSVEERFSSDNVEQNGYKRPYRPATLSEDTRFKSYYDDNSNS